jgi:bifunctional enzyme CysN/CysC
MSLDVLEYLDRHEQKELLRFVVVGSVDDGKSTLIGRLLHDVGAIYEDQLGAVRRASKMAGTEIDFSLFTDGLIAEREQGITIDVAYRYFSTERRKYIIADTPGHEQYTRNMATGASTARLAVVIIDARYGLLTQTRRHAFIASLLGISELVVAINKMDIVGYDEATYTTIEQDVASFVNPLAFRSVTTIAMSAVRGDNVVHRSAAMPWYQGPTLLEHLEAAKVSDDESLQGFRMPVQLVLRPNLDYRGFAGQLASGRIRKNEQVSVFPSGKTSRIIAIETPRGEVAEAIAPESVVVRLADEVDISRGDVITGGSFRPHVASSWKAHVVWMSTQPLALQRSYWLKSATRTVRAVVSSVEAVVNLKTLASEAADAEAIGLNAVAHVEIRSQRALVLETYRENHTLGSFILIDPLTNDTVAAGMIDELAGGDGATEVHDGPVTGEERAERLGHHGLVVGVASRERAEQVERALFERGIVCAIVAENIAAECARVGLVAVTVGARGDGVFVLEDGLSPSADTIGIDAIAARVALTARQR